MQADGAASLKPDDALLIADVQNDFLPGGALGIRGGDEIVPVLLTYIHRFQAKGLPIFLSRDWHPSNHCSFHSQGGPWPVHCVGGSPGSLPPPSFEAPSSAVLIYKAIDANEEAYSAFQHTPLHRHLQALGVRRLFIGGLAFTDPSLLSVAKLGILSASLLAGLTGTLFLLASPVPQEAPDRAAPAVAALWQKMHIVQAALSAWLGRKWP